jgi:hypothetical protein
MDPLVLFFVLGVLARLARSDLKLPEALYETLSIYLLLAIGLKGGVELAKHSIASLSGQALAAVMMGIALPFVAYPVLRVFGGLQRADAASIAGHYGSVSVVTFAVGISYLTKREVGYEPYMPLFVALLEVPGIAMGILLARLFSAPTQRHASFRWGTLAHEIVLGKSMVLLMGGLAIGWIAGPAGIDPMKGLFFDLFKGVLALFLLEMGLVAASRLGDFRSHGRFLVPFAIAIPLAFGFIGLNVGKLTGLGLGGATLLATLAASASYIAAPAAMRIAIPEANPTLSIGCALGITFPFNVTLGIPCYHLMAQWLYGV